MAACSHVKRLMKHSLRAGAAYSIHGRSVSFWAGNRGDPGVWVMYFKRTEKAIAGHSPRDKQCNDKMYLSSVLSRGYRIGGLQQTSRREADVEFARIRSAVGSGTNEDTFGRAGCLLSR